LAQDIKHKTYHLVIPDQNLAEQKDFFDTIKLDKIPLEDALLREEIENEEGYALLFSDNIKYITECRML
jgi:hypothetical protein